MKLAVLVNGASASASEIVAGAVQDLDAGVIIGPSGTYGKGLVQKIVPLPYDTALKYTIAKYYTPSGRCIQSIKYNGGRDTTTTTSSSSSSSSSSSLDDSLDIKKYDNDDEGQSVPENERKTFYTKKGRPVRDGGGVEPDILVDKMKNSPSEGLYSSSSSSSSSLLLLLLLLLLLSS